MIYIKTKLGWYCTGEHDLGQIRISWNQYAIVFYDTDIEDYCFPGQYGHYRSRGMQRLSPIIKLKMWLGDDSFEMFNEADYRKRLYQKKVISL